MVETELISIARSDTRQSELWMQQQQEPQPSNLHQQQHRPPQQQQQAATKVLLLGIDPDTSGAIAVVSADLQPYSQLLPESCSSNDSSRIQQQQQQQQPLFRVDLSRASVAVYDMPIEQIALKKKSKAAPQRYRR
jgi:hypothetical protein